MLFCSIWRHESFTSTIWRLAAAPRVKTRTKRMVPSMSQLFWQFEGRALSFITFVAASTRCECWACVSTRILQQTLSCATISCVLSLYYTMCNLTWFSCRSMSTQFKGTFISISRAQLTLVPVSELFLQCQLASSQSPYGSCIHHGSVPVKGTVYP